MADENYRQALRSIQRMSPEQRLRLGLELVNKESYALAESHGDPEDPHYVGYPYYSDSLFMIWARVWLSTLAAREAIAVETGQVLGPDPVREAFSHLQTGCGVGTVQQHFEALRAAVWG